MSAAHPLDRLAWSALTGPQASFAVRHGSALRFDPQVGMFAAVAERTPEALADLAALARDTGAIILMEPEPPPTVPGLEVASRNLGVQMVADSVAEGPQAAFEIVPLGDEDADEMIALATLTRPGPFFSRTHQLGEFVGVKEGGRLVAMAGERMKAPGFTEVSGVCTRPGFRGRGYAAALMRHVARQILARGEQPFLHSYASNSGAIALYEALGFRIRTEVAIAVLAPPGAAAAYVASPESAGSAPSPGR